MNNLRRFTLLLLLLALTGPRDVPGQDARSSVRGQIVSRQTLRPVEGAKIVLRRMLPAAPQVTTQPFDTTFQASSDSAGRFLFEKLRAGRYMIEASHALDSLPPTVLDLARSERVDVELMVGREEGDPDVTVLPVLSVEGVSPAARSMSVRDDFESRRRTGLGQYITRDVIQKRNASTLSDVFRMVSGLEVRCRRTECLPRMVRARPGCWPSVVLDGITTDLRIVNSVGPNDVHGMEVYLGLAEAPMEFTGVAPCGVIVIWTRLHSDERRNKQPAGSAKP